MNLHFPILSKHRCFLSCVLELRSLLQTAQLLYLISSPEPSSQTASPTLIFCLRPFSFALTLVSLTLYLSSSQINPSPGKQLSHYVSHQLIIQGSQSSHYMSGHSTPIETRSRRGEEVLHLKIPRFFHIAPHPSIYKMFSSCLFCAKH